MNREEAVGKKFQRLTVLGWKRSLKRREILLICQCDCGTIKDIAYGNLINKNSPIKSCGCLFPGGNNYRHGGRYMRAYRIWKHVKNRCFNKNDRNYRRYGGRGITMCERWRNSFPLFLEDMCGECPPGYSIERIDNNGNYEPANCKWIPHREQAKNREVSRKFTINGETKTKPQWCDIFGLSTKTVSARIRLGWPEERLFAPKRNQKARLLPRNKRSPDQSEERIADQNHHDQDHNHSRYLVEWFREGQLVQPPCNDKIN